MTETIEHRQLRTANIVFLIIIIFLTLLTLLASQDDFWSIIIGVALICTNTTFIGCILSSYAKKPTLTKTMIFSLHLNILCFITAIVVFFAMLGQAAAFGGGSSNESTIHFFNIFPIALLILIIISCALFAKGLHAKETEPKEITKK